MEGLFIGLDTSCYTTSFSCVDEKGIVLDNRTVLSVAEGERGLRQSDGVFQHVRNLGAMIPQAFSALDRERIRAVGVSARPRLCEDSYMPVFLAGKTAAAALSSALGVPLYEFSHQQGHIRAALLGNEQLMGKRMLSMHISGGTTEILDVDEKFGIRLIGGSEDLHAGQFVDRLGVAMGMRFPCGREMEKLAWAYDGARELKLPSSVRGCSCSFSGVESAAQRLLGAKDTSHEAIAYAVYDCMARTFTAMLCNASLETDCHVALIAGGVASSALLRKLMAGRMSKKGGPKLFFGESALSSDNAVGTALLTRDMAEHTEKEAAQ